MKEEGCALKSGKENKGSAARGAKILARIPEGCEVVEELPVGLGGESEDLGPEGAVVSLGVRVEKEDSWAGEGEDSLMSAEEVRVESRPGKGVDCLRSAEEVRVESWASEGNDSLMFAE